MRQRMQGAGFGNGFAGESQAGAPGWTRGPPQPEALLVMAQRIPGPEPALGFSGAEARLQGKAVCPTRARFQGGAGGVFGVAAAEALKSGFPGGAGGPRQRFGKRSARMLRQNGAENR